MKTRWGILSTAKIGLQKVIPAIQKAYNCEVVAIASRSIENAKNAAKSLSIPKAYSNYMDLLNDPEVEVIYNPLPNHLHVEWTIKALEHGKHVLCEKPIGLNATEAEKLAETVSKFPHLKVMEAFMYRFHPQWIKVKKLIDEGALGTLQSLQAYFSYFNADPNNIRNKVEIGGGALMDIGCYCISFARFVFNAEPIRVNGLVVRDPQLKTDVQTSALMDFGKGRTSQFVCSTQLMPFQRVQILGTSGRIEVDIPVNTLPDQEMKITLYKNDESKVLLFFPVDQYTKQAEAFAEAIQNNSEVPTSLTDAINNMKVIDAIFESEKLNQWVNL